jgi:hypothetical protein
MSVTSMWTHGNSLRVEDPGEYADVRHRGWGAELNFNPIPVNSDDDSYRNSHIPIPTPASVDGASPMLTKITILFETDPNLFISQVDVWDGNEPVAQFPANAAPGAPPGVFTGNLSHLAPDSTNQLTLNPPYRVQYGIGVSLRCLPMDSPALKLTVAAVGADFVFPNPPLLKEEPKHATSARQQPVGKRQP